jgi:hypothetical protein
VDEQGPQFDHAPLSVAKVKNELRHTFAPPLCICGMQTQIHLQGYMSSTFFKAYISSVFLILMFLTPKKAD